MVLNVSLFLSLVIIIANTIHMHTDVTFFSCSARGDNLVLERFRRRQCRQHSVAYFCAHWIDLARLYYFTVFFFSFVSISSHHSPFIDLLAFGVFILVSGYYFSPSGYLVKYGTFISLLPCSHIRAQYACAPLLLCYVFHWLSFMRITNKRLPSTFSKCTQQFILSLQFFFLAHIRVCIPRFQLSIHIVFRKCSETHEKMHEHLLQPTKFFVTISYNICDSVVI